MIVVLPEFEPRRRCEAIIDAATMAQAVRDTSTLREVAATSIARPVIHRVHETVARIGGDAGVVVDYSAVTAMRVGASHPPHADAVRRNAHGGWEPNHTPQRTWTALLYLNSSPESFRGGALVFRRSGVTVVPRAGTLVVAPTTSAYEHEVLEVTQGVRWLLAVWFRAA